ncbi:putative potassium transporter 17 [Hibiscus syriacus]|uniref:Potassium transporter 17 n=1 Tax=Hibiscus syriacus TaxID=106335 RepID=A0A6A2ZIG2_HIBSY|nr:putative potassium transporter 17 [Hibiscus syriacus]
MVARRVLLFIAMLGTCMLIGDGILTPAISVLSAMDGLRAPFPSVTNQGFITTLHCPFLLEKRKRRLVDAWWYHPLHHRFRSVVCRFEELFADLGHFNRSSIQIAFLFTIYPSLVLTYAGQAAYSIKNPNDHIDGFYKFVPKTIYGPIFIIASSAAVVASQSLVSATFSVIKQSIVLDYFPRVKVVHTSSNKEGEVYSPEVNYILVILCVAVILVFGDGQVIGNALGVYVSAVLTKILEGGWIPFAISFILAFIMFGWTRPCRRFPDCVSFTQTYKADSLNLEGDDFGQDEISELGEAKAAGVIHVRGKARFYVGKKTGLFDRLMPAFYEVLHNNCSSALPSLGVPLPQRLEVGMFYEA